MKADCEGYRRDLQRLLKLSRKLFRDAVVMTRRDAGQRLREGSCRFFFFSYQNWYSEASAFIRQVLPSRFPEFEFLYTGDPDRKTIAAGTYAIRDWFLDTQNLVSLVSGKRSGRYVEAVRKRYEMQYRMLDSAAAHFLELMGRYEASDFDPSDIKNEKEMGQAGTAQAQRDFDAIILENEDILKPVRLSF